MKGTSYRTLTNLSVLLCDSGRQQKKSTGYASYDRHFPHTSTHTLLNCTSVHVFNLFLYSRLKIHVNTVKCLRVPVVQCIKVSSTHRRQWSLSSSHVAQTFCANNKKKGEKKTHSVISQKVEVLKFMYFCLLFVLHFHFHFFFHSFIVSLTTFIVTCVRTCSP